MKGFVALLFCYFIMVSSAFASGAYEKNLKISAEFKNADKRLNEVYKQVMNSLSLGEKRILLLEQRWWNNVYFDQQVQDRPALEVLNERISDLEKLNRNSQPFRPFDLDLTLGHVIPINDAEKTIETKILGEDVSVQLEYDNFSFLCQPHDSLVKIVLPQFKNFIDKYNRENGIALSISQSGNAYQTQTLSTLYAVSATFSPYDERGTKLLESFSKKYKQVYLRDPILADILNIDVDDEGISGDMVFEDHDKYIHFSKSGGTVESYFTIRYIDKHYVCNKIFSSDSLREKSNVLAEKGAHFYLFEKNASATQVAKDILRGVVEYMYSPDGSYFLMPQMKNKSGQESQSYLTIHCAGDKAFGMDIRYVSDFIGEDAVTRCFSKTSKKCKKIEDDVFIQYFGFVTNHDSAYKCKDYYAYDYFDKYAGGQSLFIGDIELVVSVGLQKKAQDEKESARMQEVIANDVDKF